MKRQREKGPKRLAYHEAIEKLKGAMGVQGRHGKTRRPPARKRGRAGSGSLHTRTRKRGCRSGQTAAWI